MYQRQSAAPLVDALRRYVRRKPIVFHVPGHLQGAGADPAWRRLVGRKSLNIDLTEAPGLDDLHSPTGAIAKAQALAAEAFGASRSFFLVSGTTGGLQAAILAQCKPSDTVLVPRHAHRSVLGALLLSRAMPEYLVPEYDAELDIPLGITPSELQRALSRAPSARVMVAVHPTYLGFAGPLRELCDLAHMNKVSVVADEAHGAHFWFAPGFPKPALQAGADISIQSIHKTAGSLTQSSLLHVSYASMVDPEALAWWLSILQTSSPSYLLMASLDAARRQLAKRGDHLWHRASDMAKEVRARVSALSGLRCLSLSDVRSADQDLAVTQDPTKLVVDVRGRGLTGYQAANCLWKEGVGIELAGPGYVLALVTPFHRDADIRHLVSALSRLKPTSYRRLPRTTRLGPPPMPEVVMAPGDAIRCPKRQVSLEQAIGALAAEIIAPYPPGVAVLAPGERVTREMVDYLMRVRSMGTRLQGCKDSWLQTLVVVGK